MKLSVQPNVRVHMQRRDFQRINKAKPGSMLFCDTGVLWVTQSGDYRDYIMLPGDQMVVANRSKILVEAMRDADFHVGQVSSPSVN